MNNVRSEAGLARQEKIETSRRFRGKCNSYENECQVSLPSLHNKPYPSLGLCFPQAILEDSTFAIAIINVTFYYSATLASVYASSTRLAVCIIRGILALYSENAAKTISEGLKSKIFMGGIPPDPLVCGLRAHLCSAGNPPVNFCLHPCMCVCACVCVLPISAAMN